MYTTQAQFIHLHGPQKGSAEGQQAYGHKWKMPVPAAILVNCTVPRQPALIISWGKRPQYPGGRKSPHAEQGMHTWPKHFSLAFLFSLNWQMSPGKLKVLKTNVGIWNRLYVLYYSTEHKQARQQYNQSSAPVRVAAVLTLKTYVLFFLCYTKWYITLVLFSFAFQLTTYWLEEHFWASPSHAIIFIISHF